ncbi:MAG: AmmeMemoRadiSam system protein B [Candidatus Omnitrophica bacterium]|nr:AmmeMemoRadiSam system protein B [Candidatus Omnitrophota bacterium]
MGSILIASIFCFPTQAQVDTKQSRNIKKCEFAGSFYPLDKAELDSMIERFLNAAEVPPLKDNITGIIVPHAGYIYSGQTAAYGYKTVQGKKFDMVILLGPSHRHGFKGISIYPLGSFETPLGNCAIDSEVAKELTKLSCAQTTYEYFTGEHNLEVQIPFIIKTLKDTKIVPVLFGQLNRADVDVIAKKIADIAKRKDILVVVSTDLSHYLPYDTANAVDNETLRFVKDKDIDSLFASVERNEGRACGIFPLLTFLAYAKETNSDIEILQYANSGDTAGNKKAVVGYASAVAFPGNADNTPEIRAQKSSAKPEKEESMEGFTLTHDEKMTLLKIARSTLENYLKTSKAPHLSAESGNLREKRGAFVTLTKNGELRGCIGRIVADSPLNEVIAAMAIEAATGDPRFPAVSYKELKDIQIEISVLTPFEKVTNLDEIEVGKHGLIIKKGFYSGLLLPQVPGEYGWDRETFLKHTCIKAGLPPDAYKDPDATLYKFSALVFKEKELSKK